MAGNVLIVPGFGASTLRWQNLFRRLQRIWYSPIQLAFHGPESMALAANGVNPAPVGGLSLLPGPGYEFGVYDELKKQLVADGWTVSLFAWDWRLSLTGNAQRLVTALATQYGDKAFYVVTHSAGGLLAQLAYPFWVALNTGGAWNRTMYLACPHGGSMWGAAGLSPIAGDGFWLYVWMVSFVNAIQGNFPNALGIGQPSRQRIGKVIASWPAIYELMPNNLGPWASISPNIGRLYSTNAWSDQTPWVQQQWLTQAQATQQRLVDLLSQPRASEIVVAGTGFATLGGVTEQGDPADPDTYSVTLDGDGTTPRNRSVLPNQTAITGPWTHTTIVQDGEVLSNVSKWLTDPPTQSVQIDPGPLKGIAITPGVGVNPPGLFIPIPGGPRGPNVLGGVDP